MEHLYHPSPHFNDAKMARFELLRAFIIALGGMGDSWTPFYTVQDCRSYRAGNNAGREQSMKIDDCENQSINRLIIVN